MVSEKNMKLTEKKEHDLLGKKYRNVMRKKLLEMEGSWLGNKKDNWKMLKKEKNIWKYVR